ncbi:MAG TPA: transcriptional repressor [Phycisphaerae bacterium]|nr:transcriptional repressor [Phycisphaerae bacterium]
MDRWNRIAVELKGGAIPAKMALSSAPLTPDIQKVPMPRAVGSEIIDTAENVFREFCRDRGLKYTVERRDIVRAVMSMEEHFEAEQLLLIMRQTSRRVGKATVYRTLKLLVECGIVKEVHFSNKQVHYEHTYGQDPHDHMVCRRCGRIIEFGAADVAKLRTIIAAEHRFHALSHRFQILGLCETCVKACPIGPRLKVVGAPAAVSKARDR